MKILIVITQGTWGGAQRYVLDLVSKLSGQFEVTVAVGEPNGKKDLQDNLSMSAKGGSAFGGNNEINVIQLKHQQREISLFQDILAVFELAELYKRLKPDIVHINSSKAGITGALAKLLITNRPLPIVYTVHGWVFNEPLGILKKNLYKWLESFTAKFKNKIVVLSPQDMEAGRQIGIAENKMEVIPLGIEMPAKIMTKEEARREIASSTRAVSAPRNGIWVGTIANFYVSKGLDVLIEAVRLLNASKTPSCLPLVKDERSLNFFIIGDGPERANLEKMIETRGLADSIHLLGAINDAARLLPAFDLYIMPSRKEGLPYAILEAMAYQIPIIATKVGGVSSLIEDKKTGLLINASRPEEIVESISLFLTDNSPFVNRARAAFLKVHQFDVQTMVREIISLYRSLLY